VREFYPERQRRGKSAIAYSFDRTMKALLLATMVVGTGLAMQAGKTPTQNLYGRVATSLVQAITRTALPAPAPSAFAIESQMTPAQLMDRWNPLIEAASHRFGISAAWIRAVMRFESGGRTMLAENTPIESSAGAMGVMQVMPGTYDEMREEYVLGSDPRDPYDNVFAGAAYLRWLNRKFGYPALFAVYNDGPGHFKEAVEHNRRLPAETRNYESGIASLLGNRPRRDSLERRHV
jgi:soluble lytic murein transglycosylase-like protein